MNLEKGGWEIALQAFSKATSKKKYKRISYDKWKDYNGKFNKEPVEIVCDGDGVTITSNKGSVTLKKSDGALGAFIYDEYFKEAEESLATSINAAQCTSSNVYTPKNYKVDLTGIHSDGTASIMASDLYATSSTTGISAYSMPKYSYNEMCDAIDDLSFSADKAASEMVKLKAEVAKLGEVNKNMSMINEKEKNMKGFNFDFGPCTNDNVRMSMYGLAVQNNNGEWVSYNNGQVVNVDILNFDGRKYMFKMPVAIKDIAVGDIIIHNRVPMFVTSVEGGIHVVDVRAGEKKEIIPTTNMFGFNFITKIVSFFNAMGDAPTADQPFGNMLPFMMMGENGDIDPMMLMMMMNGGKMDMSNPMMLYFLCGKDNKSDMLPLMMMMGMQHGKHE